MLRSLGILRFWMKTMRMVRKRKYWSINRSFETQFFGETEWFIRIRGFCLYVLLIPLLFTSCIRKIEGGDKIPKIQAYFVHAFICPDSVAAVQVGKVSGITEPVQFIDDALVELFNSNKGKRWSLPVKNSGNYKAECDVNFNDSVWVDVTLTSGKISKRIKVPNAIKIQKVVKYNTTIGFVGPTRAYRIAFKDSAYTDNFYRIYLKQNRRRYLDNGDSLDWIETVSIAGDELPFVRNTYNSYATKEILFSDETVNGLKSDFVVYERVPSLKGNEVILSTTVFIENISEDLFDYYNSRNAHLWQQSSIIQTPTRVQGNLGSVFGVIGAYTIDTYPVD